jgi:hypothetical protein
MLLTIITSEHDIEEMQEGPFMEMGWLDAD